MEKYRAATANDIKALAIMNRQLMEDEGYTTFPSLEKIEETLAKWLISDKHTLIVATAPENPQEIMGYVLYRDDHQFTYINHFFIARTARRTGVGRRLMQEVEKAVLTPNKPIRLDVLHQNKSAQTFYQTHQYRIFGFAQRTLLLQKTYGT